MSKDLTISKDKVLKASEKCEQFKSVAETLWPELFEEKEEWVDITESLALKWDSHMEGYYNIHFLDGKEEIGWALEHQRVGIASQCCHNYRVEFKNADKEPGYFRILKRK